MSRQQNKREQAVEEVSQQLDQAQPTKRRVDVDTKVRTRNYLDRVYLNTVDKVHASDDVKNEFKRVGFNSPEKASGSGDKANCADDTSRPRGRPRKNFKLMMEQMTPQGQQVDLQNIRKQMITSGRIRNSKQQLMNLSQ